MTAPAFRSRLEREVADEMDDHRVPWRYEQPLPSDLAFGYLPDFTIDTAARPDLDLPAWIEVKPQEFIYDLRDTLGITRKYGERFAGVASASDSAKDLYERQVQELWKPKWLAEASGREVWVVGGVGGTSRLSIVMTPTSVDFVRDNWLVNWPGVQRKQERARQDAESEARAAAWRAEYEKQQAERLDVIRSIPVVGANRLAGVCAGCRSWVHPGGGNLRKAIGADGQPLWLVVCKSCEAPGVSR